MSPDDATHEIDQMNLVVAPYIPKGAGAQAANTITPYDYLKMLEKERAAFEDARVLYVAATRAERCLHLLGAAKVNSKGEIKAPKNTFLEMLWPIVHDQFNEAHAIKPPTDSTTNTVTNIDSTITLEKFKPQLIRLNHVNTPSIFAKIKIVESGNNSKKEDNSNTLDTDIGILTHLYLELMAKSDLKRWPENRIASLENAMQRWFKQKAYGAAIASQSAKRVITLISTALASEQGQWVLQDRKSAANELAITSVHEQAVHQKVVDRTFIDSGVRWVIDYKSTALAKDSSDETLQAIAVQYQAQLDAYAALFEDENLPIQKAIFFVSIGRLFKLN